MTVRTRAGAEAGRGLSAYASADISRIAGHKSGEIAGILGYSMLGRSPFTLDFRNGTVEFAGITSH